MTPGEIALVGLIMSSMILAYFAGYYNALRQAKEAVRFVRSTIRLQELRNNK